jgi:DNA-binding beta-propeller fold protein YncE
VKKENRKMKIRRIAAISIGIVMIFSGVLSVSAQESPASPQAERTYTTDADFEEGVSTGVEIVENQLQLSDEPVTLPFIWVPGDEGVVSKVDTETGDELGRYRVALYGGSPSRTSVDLEGSVWVGLRTAGTVVKIGLYEAGQYIDRNEDGIIQTSRDLDGDGDITGDEILPWGQDECVLFEVVLVPGHEGTYVPGTYEGPYDTDYWGISPRGLAVDAENNLWVGTGSPQKLYYIDGATGEILDVVDVSPWDHYNYGATIDRNGVLWLLHRWHYPTEPTPTELLRVDPSDLESIRVVHLPYEQYAFAPDYLGHLFLTGWESNKLFKIDIETDEMIWVKNTTEGCARGVVVTPKDNHVWVADTCRDSVLRYDNDGNFTAEIEGLAEPSGIDVDEAGKVWATDKSSEYIHRIDPETNTIDLSKRLTGTGGHYSYSDMTGVVLTTMAPRTGNWTVIHDSDEDDTAWETVSWTSEEPEGTLIKAEARSSHNGSIWSAWETAQNGVPLTETPEGRYVEIRVTLQSFTGEQSPFLYDLTVKPAEPVSRCFIATAAYGTPVAEEVQILREFRDEYLLTNPLGQALVGLYYRVSPPVAEFIAEHPSLKPIVRTGLVPAVAMSSVVVNTTLAEKAVIVGLLVLVSVAVAVLATRRRGRGTEYV